MRFDCANFGLVLNSFEEDIALDDLCRFRIRNDGMLGKVALPGTARFGSRWSGIEVPRRSKRSPTFFLYGMWTVSIPCQFRRQARKLMTIGSQEANFYDCGSAAGFFHIRLGPFSWLIQTGICLAGAHWGS